MSREGLSGSNDGGNSDTKFDFRVQKVWRIPGSQMTVKRNWI